MDPATATRTQTRPVVTVIRHHDNTAELTDNAVTCFDAMGFDIQHRYPFDGDQLLAPESAVTPTIVLGGAQNVTDLSRYSYLNDELRWIEACLQANVPILGICLGAQLLAHTLGAKISAREPAECEYGFYTVYPTDDAGDWLPAATPFMQAHLQEFTLPDGAVRLAYSDRYAQQAFRYGQNACSVQFHPEVNTEIFYDWLADSWSDEMAATPGAQAKTDQSSVARDYLVAQQRWFEKMLKKMFGSSAT